MRRLWLVALAVAVVTIAACGDDGGAASDGGDGADDGAADSGRGGGKEKLDLLIGDSIPLTGALRDFGPPGQKAADLAIRKIKKAIKEVGADHEVEILHLDNATNPQTAVQVARRMSKRGASCIAGAWAPGDTIATAREVSIPQRILQITPTSSELPGLEREGLLYRAALPDTLQGPALADFVEQELKDARGKLIAVGARDDLYGKTLARAFSEAWKEKRGEIAGGGPLLYDPEQRKYKSEAKELLSKDPDAFVIVDFPETFKRLGRKLLRTGEWDRKKTFATEGLVSKKLASKEFVHGIRGTTPGVPDKKKASVAWDKRYAKRKPKDVKRMAFDAQNFDAVVLCYLAAVAAGSTDGEEMAAKLRKISGPPGDKYTWEELPDAIQALQDGSDIDYLGASGQIDMDEMGDATVGVYDIYKYKKRGVLKLVGEVPVGTRK